MPDDPWNPISQTNTVGPTHRSPEEEELQRKRMELSLLETELAEAELGLATLRSELIAFDRHYFEVVGRHYAEIDRLEAQIADCIVLQNPADPSARAKAHAAQARARESEKALGDVGDAPSDPNFTPTEELKELYRRAAKQLHPDLTTDEGERLRRKSAMAELNKAFEECDAERVRRILDEWHTSPENVQGEGAAAELVRVIRGIAQSKTRLAAIKEEIHEHTQSELYQLKQQIEEAANRGQDLLAEMAKQLDERIEQTRVKLKEILDGA